MVNPVISKYRMLYCPSVDHASFFTVWGSTWLMVNQKKDDQGPFILVIFSSYWCISILYFCHILEGNTSNSSDTTFRYLLSNFSPDKGLRGEDLVHAGGDDDVLLPEVIVLPGPHPVPQPAHPCSALVVFSSPESSLKCWRGLCWQSPFICLPGPPAVIIPHNMNNLTLLYKAKSLCPFQSLPDEWLFCLQMSWGIKF